MEPFICNTPMQRCPLATIPAADPTRRALCAALAALGPAGALSACANRGAMSDGALAPSADARQALAPSGRLRAAINYGNAVLAKRDSVTGEASGVSVDLARELATRLGVPLDVTAFDAAGKAVDALRGSACDIGFVAIDPLRAAELDYTAPYVIIEGAYLVRESSPIRQNDAVDRAGVRVVVGRGSAYDLYLSRELKSAQIVRVTTSAEVVDAMLAQNLEVAAGVKQQLEADARRVPAVRLLPGRFMAINQAMATPKGRGPGVAYLSRFVEEMKASGFVARALARHGIEGAAVAPAA